MLTNLKFQSMKKLLLTLVIAFVAVSVFAQTDGTRRVYCELLGVQKGLFSSKVKITVDFGQETNFWKGTKDQQLVDENGKNIDFNSMIDGMNYMGNNGWKFVQAYVITEGPQNVYHWLLYKDVKSEEEIYEGFMTKEQFKASQTE